MTYAKREAPVLVPIERKLCSELGLDRSEFHKTAIKEFWNRRQQSTLSLIWGRYVHKSINRQRSWNDAEGARQEILGNPAGLDVGIYPRLL